MTRGEKAAARAIALVGTRFRPQGRDPATGLDCVGLILAAYGIVEAGRDYRVRGQQTERLLTEAGRWFRPVRNAQIGDIFVLEVSAVQTHLALRTREGFVHADARRRAVVETPGDPPWPVVATLRRFTRRKE